jgi:hypothetical protein
MKESDGGKRGTVSSCVLVTRDNIVLLNKS